MVLIIVAIVVVAIKELFVKGIQKKSDKVAEEKSTTKSLKKLSKYFIGKMVIKVSWFHVAFFITAIIGGAMSVTRNIVFVAIYILVMLFIIIFSMKQQRKYNQELGIVEEYLTLYDKREMQTIVNTDKEKLDKKAKHFLDCYKISERHFGLQLSIATTIQAVLSIAMWISTF